MVFALCSVFYALSLPNQYKATTLLAPTQSNSGDFSRSLSQFSGLASLAGVNLKTSEVSESQIAQTVMRSQNFILHFINKYDIAVEVFAANGWSKDTNSLKINSEVYDVAKKKWLLEDTRTKQNVSPSDWTIYKKFETFLSISENKKTGLISVSVEYYSPEIAKKWVDLYIAEINKFMQDRQVKKIINNINYLQEQIKKTSIAEMQEVFFNIIGEQIKSRMLAEASPEYAFLIISPSLIPEEKSNPKRSSICILGTIIGGMLSIFIVLIQHYIRKPQEFLSRE